MTAHDPLCPHPIGGYAFCPWCELIAKVDERSRADERERIKAELSDASETVYRIRMQAVAEARADERERNAQAIDRMDRVRYSVEGYWTKRVSDALDAAAAMLRSGGTP